MNTILWIVLSFIVSCTFPLCNDNRIDYSRCSNNRIIAARIIQVMGMFCLIVFPSEMWKNEILSRGEIFNIDYYIDYYLCNLILILLGFAVSYGGWRLVIYMLNTTEINLAKKIMGYKE